MKKVKPEVIIYSVSGAFFSALMVWALYDVLFENKSEYLPIVLVFTFVISFFWVFSRRDKEEDDT
jgi:RsiW-degrading membrane proteinase PrsW (M82 family)